MFTGIIADLGNVAKINSGKLCVSAQPEFIKKLSLGMSIAVDGICLTATQITDKTFEIDFMPETAAKTNIGQMKAGDLVNLELPATPDTMLAGHIVQGHVDYVATIQSIKPEGNSYVFTFMLDSEHAKFLVDKGSVAVNGISLTVISAMRDSFTVGIIPHTWTHTMLHKAKAGDLVNIEVDVLAKYIAKMLGK